MSLTYTAKRIGESTAVQMIRTGGFLCAEVVYDWWRHAIYRGIPISRHSLRRYIIVGLFLIPRVPDEGFQAHGVALACRAYTGRHIATMSFVPGGEGRPSSRNQRWESSFISRCTSAAWLLIHTAPILRATPTHLMMGNFAEEVPIRTIR